MPTKSNRSWTDDDDEVLRQMVADKKSWVLIAARLKRSMLSVKSRFYYLNKKYNGEAAEIATSDNG